MESTMKKLSKLDAIIIQLEEKIGHDAKHQILEHIKDSKNV